MTLQQIMYALTIAKEGSMNKAAEKFADRILTKYKNIAVITFNWPCHGDDVKKKLVLSDCFTYMSLVVNHIRTKYETEDIYYYGTSFGGYIVLEYIKQFENPFKKIALRCPAINMYKVIMSTLVSHDDMELINKGKEASIGFDRKILVGKSFLDELAAANPEENEYFDFADDILIMHGTKDEIVPMQLSEEFCENNVIEFVPIENADHRFQNPSHMEEATKLIIQFFGF